MVEPITGVGGDGDEMDWSAGLGDGFPGGGCKECLPGQGAPPLLFVGEEVFIVKDWRLRCLGGRHIARLGGPHLV